MASALYSQVVGKRTPHQQRGDRRVSDWRENPPRKGKNEGKKAGSEVRVMTVLREEKAEEVLVSLPLPRTV
jgi:hypothetical protein